MDHDDTLLIFMTNTKRVKDVDCSLDYIFIIYAL